MVDCVTVKREGPILKYFSNVEGTQNSSTVCLALAFEISNRLLQALHEPYREKILTNYFVYLTIYRHLLI